MTERVVEHATFVIERTFGASPAQAFAAWASNEAKRRWFHGPADWTEKERLLEFRVGGRERLVGAWPDGREAVFDALYREIVPDERLVYVYDMHVGGKQISVSLATVEFKPKGQRTLLVYTEQGAFLDRLDKPENREIGTAAHFDRLAAALEE